MSIRDRSAAAKKAAARKTSAQARPASVILQARVDANFAEELLERDAAVLGLGGPSEVVREGLNLLHRRAQVQTLIDSYDTFYEGARAPLPTGAPAADAG